MGTLDSEEALRRTESALGSAVDHCRRLAASAPARVLASLYEAYGTGENLVLLPVTSRTNRVAQ